MENRNDKEPTVICSDHEIEIAHAIALAKKEAIESGNLIWIYTTGLFLCMTPIYPDGEKIVGRCYPGGRVELHRKVSK